jgi:hypothetical protein
MRSLRTSLPLLGLLALPPAVSGQESADITARANVLERIAVSNQNDLEFGDVIPGFSSSVAPDDPSAGRFLVTGASGLAFSVDFVLPPVLVRDGGGATLPLTFGAGSAGVGPTPLEVTSTFNPNGAFTGTLNGSGERYIFLGGSVTADAAQQDGTYSGTVTLNVAYTGS